MKRLLCICLITIDFLGICKAQSNCDGATNEYANEELEWFLHEEIAVSKGATENGVILTAPNKHPKKTEIDIEMFALNISNFDVKRQQFTIKMDLRISWSEERFFICLPNKQKQTCLKRNLFNGWVKADENSTWSPQIEIRSEVVSETRKNKQINITRNSQSKLSKWQENSCMVQCMAQCMDQNSSVLMSFSLTTTVKCNLDFALFPFDHHRCALLVS